MDINRKLPVWALILIDILLVAAIILPFAYFHHVRDMWGPDDEQAKHSYTHGETPDVLTGDVFLTADASTEPSPTTGPSDDPTTGSAQEIRPVSLKGDREIRAYAKEHGLTLPAAVDGASYDMLYRSENIFTVLYSAAEKLNGYLAKYYVFDVYVKDVRNFYTVNSKQKGLRELVSEGEKEFGGPVVAAVNGDYSSNKNHCRVVVRNGKLYRTPEIIDSDVCVMYYDGRIETYTPEEFDFSKVEAQSPYQIWNFGPELLDKSGRAKTEFNDEAYDRHILKNTHPRTALGYYAPGHYCLIVVDGRQNGEDGEYLYGCSAISLAQLCERIGCVRAYNMDGGDSSQAYMNGEDVRIDRTRDPQRVLSDIICVGEIAPSLQRDEPEKTDAGGAE